MGQPQKVKLFIGMLSNEEALIERIEDELMGFWGPIDLRSPVWKWTHTSYYDKEMGTGLMRKFIFFHTLIRPESLIDIKLKAIEIEKSYPNDQGGRRINLDPGYLNTAKIVLASTKDFSHRMYLGRGIFGEVTLYYSKGQYRALPYTFPDYRTRDYKELFERARQMLKEQNRVPSIKKLSAEC
jgi:hypothetical protein